MSANPSPAPVPSASVAGEHHDVVIIGAGLSGVGAAYRLQTERPRSSYAVLEARENLGGTWDLFRYPGVRSDSDMYTLGYAFKPWPGAEVLADGDTILDYIRDTAQEFGITEHIQYASTVVAADFDTTLAHWVLTVQDTRTSARRTVTCGFLYCCTGYYDYARPHDPPFAGASTFTGTIVHPQFWPPGLDYAGKRVVVIGSGATAVTLIPALLAGEKAAGHVTMLQRSPSWIAPVPRRDPVAERLKALLPAALAHRLIRGQKIAFGIAFYRYCRTRPQSARRFLTTLATRVLGDAQAIAENFTPAYDPWDQRICAAPGGDLFRVIRSGRADVVTEQIDAFVPEGVRLASGRVLSADIVVTATGLRLLALGGLEPHVDGRKVDLAQQYVWNGAMISGLPNVAVCIGYTNASWTLRADLTHRLVTKVLGWMQERGHAAVVPAPPTDLRARPLLDLASGYVQRSLSEFPRQGDRGPWLVRQNYVLDSLTTLHTDLARSLRPLPPAGGGSVGGWAGDLLGPDYEQRVLELGADPDGEGDICAVLVRRTAPAPEPTAAAVLYLHGFADYFFQTDLADFFAERGHPFYALDLRKSGRARRAGQSAHYVSDLALYDEELERALALIGAEHPDRPVTIVAHSTGGLIAALFLDRRRRVGRSAPVTGLVLNSPWLDLQGSPAIRTGLTFAVRVGARLQPLRVLKLPASAYVESLHVSGTGEWDFDLNLKPLAGFGVTVGWLNAVRRGHALLHRGLEVGVPCLVLSSDSTHFSSRSTAAGDHADMILDVHQIAHRAGCLGEEVTLRPIAGARHDVFLSLPQVRQEAYRQLGTWLSGRTDPPATREG